MGSLLRFKSAFKELVGTVPEPEQWEVWLWMDMQVSAYKLNGGVMMDCEDRESGKDMPLPRWLNRALSQKNLLQFSQPASEEADGKVSCGCKRKWEGEEGRGFKASSAALDVSVTSELPLSQGSPESASRQVSPGNDFEGADENAPQASSPDPSHGSLDKTANGSAMSPDNRAAVQSGLPAVTSSPASVVMDGINRLTTDTSSSIKQEPVRIALAKPIPSDLSASAALKALSNQVVSGVVSRPLHISDPSTKEKEEGVDMADSKSLLKDSLERMRKKRKCEQPVRRPQVSPQQLSPPELNNNNNNKKTPAGIPFNSHMTGSLSDSVLRNLLNKPGHDKSANHQHQLAETPSEAVLNLSVGGGRGNMVATTPPSSTSSSPSPSFSETLHFHAAPPRLTFGPTFGEVAIASTVKNTWTEVSEKMRSSMTPGGRDWLEAMKRMTSLGLYRPILPATLDDVGKESMAAQLGLMVPDVKHSPSLHVPIPLHDHGNSGDSLSHCYTCSMCGKVFENEILLRNHAACHDRNSSYVCVHCGRKFNDRMHLDLHCSAEHGGINEEVGGRPLDLSSESPAPSSRPKSPKSLTAEDKTPKLVTINGNTMYVCQLCKKGYNNKSNFKRHMRILHEHYMTHFCQHCGKGFYRSDHYRMHTNSCKGQKMGKA